MKRVFVLLVFSLLASSHCLADSAPHAGTAGRWPILGDRDDEPSAVRAMQYLLLQKEFYVVVDGRFGEQTQRQVWKFQLKKHFDTAGDFAVVDARTWEALIADLKLGDKGWAVRSLQSLLRDNGFPVALDGKFGRQTQRAVLQFQKQRDMLHGVIEPGVVEHFTWCELVGGDCYKGDRE